MTVDLWCHMLHPLRGFHCIDPILLRLTGFVTRIPQWFPRISSHIMPSKKVRLHLYSQGAAIFNIIRLASHFFGTKLNDAWRSKGCIFHVAVVSIYNTALTRRIEGHYVRHILGNATYLLIDSVTSVVSWYADCQICLSVLDNPLHVFGICLDYLQIIFPLRYWSKARAYRAITNDGRLATTWRTRRMPNVPTSAQARPQTSATHPPRRSH